MDQERFIAVDEADPRQLGEGPCAALHQLGTPTTSPAHPSRQKSPTRLADAPRDIPFVFGGNQHGRWVECGRCGLRLGYWPKRGALGRPAPAASPDLVRAALAAVRLQGWGDCPAARVRAALLELRARPAGRASGAAGAPSAPSAAPAAPRARSCGPATDPAASERGRAPAPSRRRATSATVHVSLSAVASPGATVTVYL